ncbi:MAG: hypothetical protein NC180_04145 [Muribaculaceae bacterium]|nr:hypothetical protein [Roseburia sp.]MCM1430406.1 hypothetical protein [Muribaculaceae bacterium]MCM1492398.1 hypothetical protein [Muribaculaceae bacterium]
MTIVLLILKVIGMILLAVLGLLVCLLLLVLFVPVRYRIRGSFHEQTLRIRIRADWLFKLFIFAFDQLPEDNRLYLRLFGIKKNLAKADNTWDFEETIEENAKEAAAKTAEDIVDGNVEETIAETAEDASMVAMEVDAAGSAPDGRRKSLLGRVTDRLRELWQRFLDICRRIRDIAKRLPASFARIKALVQDDQNQAAVSFLVGKLFRLLKKLVPKKFMLKLIYSAGSPDTTGEILGVLAMFPVGYKNRWQITPDFTAESFYAEADFDLRGRIFFYQILGTGISVLRNKDCRDLYKKLKNDA